MAKTRKPIGKATRDQVLREYNHLCAICGAASPQIHHIDEDHSNNDPENLLPLCPNHHLTDQHNPTRRVDPGLLTLFRRFKDPAILSPQFQPVYARLRFLERPEIGVAALVASAKELIAFLGALEMGDFYSSRVRKLALPAVRVVPWNAPESDAVRSHAKAVAEYVEKLRKNCDEVIKLVVEQLKYQDWHCPFLEK